jgi:DNA-3-methyladenine glycosylase II
VKPDYWDRAKRSLARRDPVMAAIMRQHRGIHLLSRGDPFQTLARSIVGQQISVKAAQSVWDRLTAFVQPLSPREVVLKERAALRACGLSDRKVEYIADLAKHFVDGTIHVHGWPGMDDESIIAELVQVRGVGRWTAEMFLIFNLLRPDVFPLDDLGLQKGLRLAYFGNRAVSPKAMLKLGETWRPWRSVATWYLWRALEPVPVEY